MKKRIMILLLSGSLVVLSSCGSASNDDINQLVSELVSEISENTESTAKNSFTTDTTSETTTKEPTTTELITESASTESTTTEEITESETTITSESTENSAMITESEEETVTSEDNQEDMSAILNAYMGDWIEPRGWRCGMAFTPIDNSRCHIDINWSAGASEGYKWSMDGTANADGTLEYSNCTCIDMIFNEDGSVTESVQYENGSGYFYLDQEGQLYWVDYMDNSAEGFYFVRFSEI